ncbi:MAG: hypothetical protein JO026_01640 [Patescibacteria group bacterium]|nr:hypothetical protein [Patescibacteria group bacterium]
MAIEYAPKNYTAEDFEHRFGKGELTVLDCQDGWIAEFTDPNHEWDMELGIGDSQSAAINDLWKKLTTYEFEPKPLRLGSPMSNVAAPALRFDQENGMWRASFENQPFVGFGYTQAQAFLQLLFKLQQ